MKITDKLYKETIISLKGENRTDIIHELLDHLVGYNYLEHHVNSLVSLYSYAGGEKKSGLPPISFIIYIRRSCS